MQRLSKHEPAKRKREPIEAQRAVPLDADRDADRDEKPLKRSYDLARFHLNPVTDKRRRLTVEQWKLAGVLNRQASWKPISRN